GRIDVIPGDQPAGVDATHVCALTRASAGTKRIKGGDAAVRGPHKAMISADGIDKRSGDRTGRVDATGLCTLLGASAGTLHLKGSERPVRAPHKAMIDIGKIDVKPGDGRAWGGVDADGKCTLARVDTGVGRIKLSESAIRVPHKSTIVFGKADDIYKKASD